MLPPVTDPALVGALHDDLVASDYDVDGVERFLGPLAAAALHREQAVPARRAVAAAVGAKPPSDRHPLRDPRRPVPPGHAGAARGARPGAARDGDGRCGAARPGRCSGHGGRRRGACRRGPAPLLLGRRGGRRKLVARLRPGRAGDGRQAGHRPRAGRGRCVPHTGAGDRAQPDRPGARPRHRLRHPGPACGAARAAGGGDRHLAAGAGVRGVQRRAEHAAQGRSWSCATGRCWSRSRGSGSTSSSPTRRS